MNKIAITASFLIGMLPTICFSQCCNVMASNNTVVTTSNGVCVALLFSSADCVSSVDTDKDGVTDDKDRCPTVAGLIETKGCPLVSVETWAMYNTYFRDVRFAHDSDSLTPKSYTKLDEVAKLMKVNSEYTLKLSGYADSVGTEAYNKILSKKRAVAVEKYLESKGIPANKVVVASYGEKFPKVTNETESGRSKNRRVEFDLIY